MPFTIEEEKRLEGAAAICAATNRLTNGCFNFDILEGTITFRIAASYRERLIGEGLFSCLIDCTTAAADRFIDQFFAINEGKMSRQEFLNQM